MPSTPPPADLEFRIAELEKRLAESQACLHLFGVNSQTGMAIFDQDCRYVQLNQFLASTSNLSIEEHLGKRPSEILPPPLAAYIEGNIRKILSTGESQLNQHLSLTLPDDPETIRHWLTSRFPLRNADGTITGVGVVVMDETGLQQLKKSLSQQEALQLALLENLPARIFMKDLAGKYLYCNDLFAADVGLAKDEIIGKNDFEIFRPEMAERYRKADLKVISSELTQEFEYQFEKNNRIYYIHVRKTPFRDANGNICGILGIFHDLTEEKQAQQQLLIADRALTATLAGIALANPAGVLTYVNQAFVKMWGYANEQEVLNRQASEFWAEPATALGVIEELYKSGQWQGEMTGRRKDGKTFQSLLAAKLVKDADGKTLCTISSFHDITAEKEAERKLRDSEEQLRQITDNIDDAVWIIDTTEARILYINPAYEKIWGHPRAAFYPDPAAWLEAVHPDDRESAINSLRLKPRERKASYRVIRPDGDIRQVFVRIFPVLDQDGRFYREVGIAQDVTVLKQAEAKLLTFSRRLNNVVEEERSAIARDLHDEFGQSLVRLRQWQKIMTDALPPSSRPLVNNDDFDEIINQLGSIIRRTTHRLRPDILDNLGLAAAIAREVKEFGTRFKSVAATFQVIGKPRHLDNEHALVFYRVLQEAMTNSARHARANRLDVRLIFSFPTVILTVEDDGVGFEPAEVNSLNEGRLGLGLRGIAERMATIGGRARVTSSPGQGTTIRAELNLRARCAG